MVYWINMDVWRGNMLFFGKHQRDEEYVHTVKSLRAELQEVKKSLEDSSRQASAGAEAAKFCREAMQEAAGEIRNLGERHRELERQIRRQSDSFEDLLEEIQGERSDREALRQERRENSRKEQALLSFILCCSEQMELLEGQIQGDGSMAGEKLEAWQHQFYTMAQERLKFMRACNLERVGQEGGQVDYETCEVLSVADTEDATKAGTVAQVYSHGFLYGGHVIKKAKVAAYRAESRPADKSLGAAGIEVPQ